MAQDQSDFQDIVCTLEAGRILAAATIRELSGSKTYDVTKVGSKTQYDTGLDVSFSSPC